MRVLLFCPMRNGKMPASLDLMLLQGSENVFVDLLLTRDNPHRGTMRDICLNYAKLPDAAKGYDKVLIVEDDMIIPPDTLSRLLSHNAEIATGFYINRHGGFTTNLFSFNSGRRMLGDNIPSRDLGKLWGKTIPVTGGCMGCLLLDASLVQGFNWDDGTFAAPDMRFMRRCAEAGVHQVADLSVACGHEQSDGRVIWPDREKGYMVN